MNTTRSLSTPYSGSYVLIIHLNDQTQSTKTWCLTQRRFGPKLMLSSSVKFVVSPRCQGAPVLRPLGVLSQLRSVSFVPAHSKSDFIYPLLLTLWINELTWFMHPTQSASLELLLQPSCWERKICLWALQRATIVGNASHHVQPPSEWTGTLHVSALISHLLNWPTFSAHSTKSAY